jgi:hypothetical protein
MPGIDTWLLPLLGVSPQNIKMNVQMAGGAAAIPRDDCVVEAAAWRRPRPSRRAEAPGAHALEP